MTYRDPQPHRLNGGSVECKRRLVAGWEPTKLGGYLPLVPGVFTVRYPIPQRTFKYVATVQSVTDEACQ